jgi:peptidoglycan L-alanyl-D-glutamate endopeptidase CwlK
MSRKIEDLVPVLQERYAYFKAAMDEMSIDYIVTCTRRTPEEQAALFAQGRTKPGKIVTWTLNSRHIGGRAFDIVIMENGKPDWSVSNPSWKRAGDLGIACGLVWGGSWNTPDYAHFELPPEVA